MVVPLHGRPRDPDYFLINEDDTTVGGDKVASLEKAGMIDESGCWELGYVTAA